MKRDAKTSMRQQIKVLQIKNFKTLKRDRRRLVMLIVYPVYMMLVLYLIKSSSPNAEPFKEWPSSGVSTLINPFASGSMVAYSCDPETVRRCDVVDDVMQDFMSRTGLDVERVSDTNTAWKEAITTNDEAQAGASIVAGIEFSTFSNDVPEDIAVKYTIRLDNDDLESSLSYGRSGVVDWNLAKPGPSSLAAEAYVNSGFVWLQRNVDCSALAWLGGSGTQGSTCRQGNPLLAPFPTVRDETFYTGDGGSSLLNLVPFYVVVAYCNVIVFVALNVVIEKQNKMVETLSIMGMGRFAYWMSWQVTISLIGGLSSAAATVVIVAMDLFPASNNFIVFLLMFLYNLTLVPLAFIIGCFLSHERIAAIVGGIGSIALGAPIFALSSLSSPILKAVTALLSPLALSQGLAVALDLETYGEGTHWGNLGKNIGGFSVLLALAFLALDFAIYFTLAWSAKAIDARGPEAHSRVGNVDRSLIEDIPEEEDDEDDGEGGLGAGGGRVSLRALSKTFRSGSSGAVVALDGLTLDMLPGQIFALLGHNGAGKSTAISLLTGLSRATSGSASIFGQQISENMDEIRQDMGYCPQHDTLFLGLTVEENLRVFAGLKGIPVEVGSSSSGSSGGGGSGGDGASSANQASAAGTAALLLERLGLESKRHSLAKTLSGGQKRALSLAIALVGNPRFLILDEPTAGMDPASRRRVWNVLLDGKASNPERVTLLTTHFLDEADVLGDRIGILAHGRLACLGSSLFLKRRLGVGYHVTVVSASQEEGGQPTPLGPVVDFIKSRAADASMALDYERGANETETFKGELHFTIPTASDASEVTAGTPRSRMTQLLLDLDGALGQLRLKTYGVSLTSLEECFLNITAAGVVVNAGGKKPGRSVADAREVGSLTQAVGNIRAFSKTPPLPTLHRQFQIMLWHRLLLMRRAVVFNLVTTIMPVAVVALCLLLQRQTKPSDPTTDVDLSAFSGAYGGSPLWWAGLTSDGGGVLGANDTMTIPACLRGLTEDRAVVYQGTPELSLPTSLLQQAKAGNTHTELYAGFVLYNATEASSASVNGSDAMQLASGDDLCTTNEIGATTTYTGNWSLFYNESRPNSLPAFLAMLDGASLLGDTNIFKVSAALFDEDGSKDVSYSQISVALTLTYLVGLTMMPIGVAFTWQVVKDRHDGRQQQLKVLGVRTLALWASSLCIDFFQWCLPITCIILVIVVDQNQMLLSHGAGLALASVLYFSGLHTVLLSYVLGNIIESPEFVSTTLSTINTLLAMVVFSIIWTVLVSTVGFSEELFVVACSLLIAFGSLLPQLLIMSAFNVILQLSAYGTAYPNSPRDYFAWSIECPYNSSNRCFGVLPLLASSALGILLSALYLSGMASSVCIGRRGALDTSESVTVSPLVDRDSDGSHNANNERDTEDQDVAAERKRVLAISSARRSSGQSRAVQGELLREPLIGLGGQNEELHDGGERDTNVVLIEHLRKEYPTSETSKGAKVAVNDMCLGISRGECFGLLGHNGAGKSSLLGMLTGVISPSSGDALINGFSIRSEMRQVLSSTGFCPQFGGLWHSLSAPEHLSFYAALRGFDKATIPSVTNEVLRAIGIDTDAAPAPNGNFSLPNTTAGSTVGSLKRVAELSGGNQRKLSAALALMGGPRIVYLDEPSTGVDVATRRHLWQIIRSHKEMRAVVLTTHSMDEADALSDRIAIMAQGKLKAIGTPQELKSRHGAEFQLDIKISASAAEAATSDLNVPDRVEQFVLSHMPGATMDSSHGNSLRFLVPSAAVYGLSGGLGAAFDVLESSRAELGIAEFSLSQTTLEQVFLRVAKADREAEEGPPN